ncbi:hypothetical protein T440DRAFT_138764 [Plenodomus tracheiphilus IPT5]|uniref:YDG domain-containing protein n=1 Tax=Plenodomus tracheiphilus IPT5 TaxID=1408161 RepID=A0A6A7B0V8_9PLEO|nr:hypothetical protein T440DRAFT_138764 [Plenodomus tracheiphilus IPT5]
MARVPSPNYMPPPTPLSGDLSRPALKRLAIWIRDDLDLLVAREGPDILRPDDVLALHDKFIALQHAQNINILDLRATGIHKAVQDIAGVATRWPGRLCDDCDKIIRIWTAKFGSLSEIHPFLYGRGGRLEGIASVSGYSREKLLARWTELSPEAIHPNRSHQLGDLGFRVGAWWINTLFALHAGIIGLEACEGGTTYDKNGAYALVLKGTGEVDAESEEKFTYRVPQDDKGKFRLTAATPKSRDPIRVLRSHSINSIWGPRAGIRYEGLYSVKGWSIKQAKTADTANGQWKEGDILYDVRFERSDLLPMSEAIRHPTATEVDDYLEFKRLRKLHRDSKRNATATAPEMLADVAPAKLAPVIAPIPPQPFAIVPGLPASPGGSRGMTSQKPHYDKKPHSRFSEHGEFPFMIVPDDDASPFTKRNSSLLKLPIKSTTRLQPMSFGNSSVSGSPDDSQASSLRTGASAQSNIKEVAPWIDYDADLVVPNLSTEPQVARNRIFSLVKPSSELKGDVEISSPTLNTRSHDRKQSTDFKSVVPSRTKKEERKLAVMRNRSPITKLFDGSVEEGSEEGFEYDRDAICPPNEWELVPGFKAESGPELEPVLVAMESFVEWPFTNPFVGGLRKRGERKDSSVVAPDEVGEKE